MKRIELLCLLVIALAIPGIAAAQDTNDDAADVILTIEEQWNAEQSGDNDWIDNLLHSKFSGWPNESPAPRSLSSVRKWDRFGDEQGEMLEHELYFQNIVVEGDTAIAHYFFTSAYQDKDEEVEVTSGRYTDVLVRTEDGWKFIAWHGGDSED